MWLQAAPGRRQAGLRAERWSTRQAEGAAAWALGGHGHGVAAVAGPSGLHLLVVVVVLLQLLLLLHVCEPVQALSLKTPPWDLVLSLGAHRRTLVPTS